MIIYRGFGWLVLIIVIGFSLGGNFAFDAMYGQGYYDKHKWPLAIALALAGVVTLLLGMALNGRSGQNRHALFFIPVQYWGPILIVIAGVVFGMDYFKH